VPVSPAVTASVASGASVPAGASDAATLYAAIVAAREQADVVLLDTCMGGRFGGTGTPFPWPLAGEAADGAPLLVAGGIDPDTAVEALRGSGAWGVDVSSGVESSPGIKDARLLGSLFERIREGTKE
jgi:phosphoribosylanthranilate isomerase